MIKYLFLLLICLSSCQHPPKEEAIIRVLVPRGPSVIALTEWLDNPLVIGNKKIRLEIFDTPDRIQASLIRQEADMAVLPMINAANLYNKKVKVKLMGCPIWGTLFLLDREVVRNPELFLFGDGTTPDILTRHYLNLNGLNYPFNYTFDTASGIAQGILAGKVDRAVLSEPFVSIVLGKDSTIRIKADLNHPANDTIGFAQTAILLAPSLESYRDKINSALVEACRKVSLNPQWAIQSLEEHQIFNKAILTPESVKRCEIFYKNAREAETAIWSFLRLIEQYEPKAIGEKLPDEGFIS